MAETFYGTFTMTQHNHIHQRNPLTHPFFINEIIHCLKFRFQSFSPQNPPELYKYAN